MATKKPNPFAKKSDKPATAPCACGKKVCDCGKKPSPFAKKK